MKYTCGYGLMTCVDLREMTSYILMKIPATPVDYDKLIPLKLVMHDMLGKFWHDVTKVQFGVNYLN